MVTPGRAAGEGSGAEEEAGKNDPVLVFGGGGRWEREESPSQEERSQRGNPASRPGGEYTQNPGVFIISYCCHRKDCG